MPKKPATDEPYVPMDVMQPQRIKVLEATIARQAREISRLTRELAKAKRGLVAVQAVETNRAEFQMTRGRRPKYTSEFLMGVWQAHQGGESVESICARLKADKLMMKTFLKGAYWTEAAKDVYGRLGIRRPPDA